jgi:hypothetical protein
MKTPAPRKMASLPEIAGYWIEHHAEVFPEIYARWNGWDEPFCFRCGWRAPMPTECNRDPWLHAKGWLVRAHIQAHADSGSGEASNLIPLCVLCHALQPEAATAEQVLTWVRASQPATVPFAWQTATDRDFGGDNFREFPGERALFKLRTRTEEWCHANGAASLLRPPLLVHP